MAVVPIFQKVTAAEIRLGSEAKAYPTSNSQNRADRTLSSTIRLPAC